MDFEHMLDLWEHQKRLTMETFMFSLRFAEMKKLVDFVGKSLAFFPTNVDGFHGPLSKALKSK
jgi:hypothetical protein